LRSIEIIGLFQEMFRQAAATKQFRSATKPFSAVGADVRKRRMVIKLTTRTADNAGNPETVKCEP
jgi:hypothetical protein